MLDVSSCCKCTAPARTAQFMFPLVPCTMVERSVGRSKSSSLRVPTGSALVLPRLVGVPDTGSVTAVKGRAPVLQPGRFWRVPTRSGRTVIWMERLAWSAVLP